VGVSLKSEHLSFSTRLFSLTVVGSVKGKETKEERYTSIGKRKKRGAGFLRGDKIDDERKERERKTQLKPIPQKGA